MIVDPFSETARMNAMFASIDAIRQHTGDIGFLQLVPISGMEAPNVVSLAEWRKQRNTKPEVQHD
jgi:hypothetical protein